MQRNVVVIYLWDFEIALYEVEADEWCENAGFLGCLGRTRWWASPLRCRRMTAARSGWHI